MRFCLMTIVALAATLASLATLAQCRAASGERQVALFELYTSEGCDSCPPADRWFSALERGEPRDRAITLAFHVDYWDRLGWRDRFASAAYTQRQNDQASRRHAAFVYTPQVLLQGEDFSWRAGAPPAAAIAAINAKAAKATIDVDARAEVGNATAIDVRVRVREPKDRAHAAIGVALVQDGLSSEVKAGENAGRRLSHDAVVRQWRGEAPRFDASGQATSHLEFPLPNDAGPLSIVALVEDDSTGAVLQAVSLPLCGR